MASSTRASAADAGPAAAAPAARHGLRALGRARTALAGLVLATGLVLGAALAPLIAPADPLAMSPRRLALPSAGAWLGTDQFGRDLGSRLLHGARISLTVAFTAVAAAAALGAAVGLTAGYFEGRADHLLMRMMDVLMAFPTLLLALAVVATLGASLTNLVLAITLAYVPIFSRIVRSSVISVKQDEFVQAARALGASDARIMAFAILPGVTAPVIVQATFNLSTAIMIEAALSFLGLGVQPPAPSWGVMLSEARSFMELAPWLAIAPGAAITGAVLGFNLFGDGLRDLLDPRLRGLR